MATSVEDSQNQITSAEGTTDENDQAVANSDGQQQEKKGTSKVFSRELYAQKDFWNDRFAESNGHFDWYANWKQIKPVFNVRHIFEDFPAISHVCPLFDHCLGQISAGRVWQRQVPHGRLR